jgi:N-acetylglucosamine-6-phosphate deacetylase
MASQVPAEFLGLGDDVGRIAPGYRANLVLADDALNVSETWIDGRSSKDEP